MNQATAASRPLDIPGFKARFQPVIEAELQQLLQQYSAFNLDPFITDLYTASADIAREGSKRIRPYIGYLSFVTFGGVDTPAVLSALCGLELLHVFALIHDDIMDHGTVRHGLPCIHVRAAETLRQSGARGDIDDVARSQAILVGDAVFNWAFQVLIAHVPTDRLVPVLKLFQAMVNEVIVGQMLDVDTVARDRVSAAAITRKTEMKTARYTYVNPMKIGAALAGAEAIGAAFGEQAGTALGIAHQMQDDLLDIIGTAKQMGKAVLSDLREHQHTFFTQYIYDHGTPAQQQQLDSYMGAALDEMQARAAIQLFYDSGAIPTGRAQIASHLATARDAVSKSLMAEEYRQCWNSFIQFLETRVS